MIQGNAVARWKVWQRCETEAAQEELGGDQEGGPASAAETRILGDEPACHERLERSIRINASDAANVGTCDRLLIGHDRL
jgi:hypothetical protein